MAQQCGGTFLIFKLWPYILRKRILERIEKSWLWGCKSESKDLGAEGSHKLWHSHLSKGSLLHTLPPDKMMILCKRREGKPCPSSLLPFGKILAELTILSLCSAVLAGLHPFGGEMFIFHGQKVSYISTPHIRCSQELHKPRQASSSTGMPSLGCQLCII